MNFQRLINYKKQLRKKKLWVPLYLKTTSKIQKFHFYAEIFAFTWPILKPNFVITHFAVLEKQRGW